MNRCPVHPDTELVTFCPACRGAQGGKATSPAKRAAVIRNARKGGRPKGSKRTES